MSVSTCTVKKTKECRQTVSETVLVLTLFAYLGASHVYMCARLLAESSSMPWLMRPIRHDRNAGFPRSHGARCRRLVVPAIRLVDAVAHPDGRVPIFSHVAARFSTRGVVWRLFGCHQMAAGLPCQLLSSATWFFQQLCWRMHCGRMSDARVLHLHRRSRH
jgi:hypothetical protein